MDPSDFPEDTILGHLRLGVYASTKSGEVSILHEGEFEDPVISFEYHVKANELIFVFEDDMRMPLGSPIEQNLIPYIMESKQIGLFQVVGEKQIGDGSVLPLEVI